MRLAFATLAIGALAVGVLAQGQPTLKDALGWLNKVKASFSPELKKDVPALEAILRRYFDDPQSLRASEEEIALAFLETMPADEELGTRGGTLDKMKKFEAMMGGSAKPTTPPKKPTTTTKPPTKPATTTKPSAAPKRKIPGIHSKATFSAIARTAPGGKRIGVVNLNISGRSKAIVEVLSGTSTLDAKKRAQVVANRMQAVSKSNRLWWTMLKVSKVNNQYVVGTSAKSFIITADSLFAKEWGLSTEQLARQLVLKIRSSLDPEKSEMFGTRDLSSDEMHLAAVDLRQQGDALYATNRQAAEAKYKAAIANDPAYNVPYLRLADLYTDQKKNEDARAILNQGIGVASMKAEHRAELEARLRKIT